jgi:ribosome-binding factor A
MQPSRRPQRLGQQIQHEISLILSRDLKDRRVGFITVTGVDLSPDYRHARVFVSSLGSDQEKKAGLDALNRACAFIRRTLGQRIRMKFLPEIEFREDSSREYGSRIDELLDQIHHEEPAAGEGPVE